MAFTIDTFFNAAGTWFGRSHIFDTGTVATGKFGGSKLKLFSKDNPSGKVLGFVVACPNVPRPWHSGFDPDQTDRPQFRGDFFGKLIYVPQADYDSAQVVRDVTDIFSVVTAIMRPAFDHIDSDGCSPGSHGTYLRQLKISMDGGSVTFGDLEGPYTVVAAKFLKEGDPGATGPMSCTEFWVASEADQQMILKTAEHDAALLKSDEVRAQTVMSGKSRRALVVDQLRKLRGAFNPDPYNP